MRLSQDSSRLLFWFLVALGLPVLVVSDSFILQVFPDIVMQESLGLLPGGDQSTTDRVKKGGS